jgi:hypothetical protein
MTGIKACGLARRFSKFAAIDGIALEVSALL